MSGTVFVAGGTGFIGRRLLPILAREHEVKVLVRSPSSEAEIRALGAQPCRGDLLEAGPWQETLRSADHVIHLAQPQTFGGRVSQARAEQYRAQRLVMDRNLFSPLHRTKRVVYVGGTSYYGGGHGERLERRDEDTAPNPRGWGPYIAPAIDALTGWVVRGIPIVTAFPGYVYGNGSWFREYVLSPLRKGKRISTLLGRSRHASPVHVSDCARAIAHLLTRGKVGMRYFVVDDEPVAWSRVYELAAQAMGKELHLRYVPPIALRLLVGKLVTESVLTDAVLSNDRLKATGFTFEYPTIETGIPAVVREAG